MNQPAPPAVVDSPKEGEFIPAQEYVSALTYGPKVLDVGGGGTGKSHALHTLEKAGLNVAVIFTEPSGMETLNDITSKEKFHWMYIPPAKPDWKTLHAAAVKINTLSFKSLTEMGDIDKRKFPQWMDFVSACGDFTCQRCGKKIGPLDELGPDWAVALDSLSGLNEMAMKMVVGLKPVKSPGDWGVAMDNLGNYVTTFTTALKCFGIITAHLEREIDPNTGMQSFQAATLGQKLAPKIGRFFSDIIMSKREGTKFTWSTAAIGVDLKARNVPIADNIEPDYRPLVAKWHKRIGYTLPQNT